jgi:hypothetical protein
MATVSSAMSAVTHFGLHRHVRRGDLDADAKVGQLGGGLAQGGVVPTAQRQVITLGREPLGAGNGRCRGTRR